jgi:hypothetical protein
VQEQARRGPAPVGVLRRAEDRVQRGVLVGVEPGRRLAGPDGDVARRPAPALGADRDQAAGLETAQALQVVAGEARQVLQQRDLLGGQARGAAAGRLVGALQDHLAVLGALRPQLDLLPRAARRQHQRQRARRRRGVLARQPQPEVDEVGGQRVGQHAQRRHELVLGLVGQPGDDRGEPLAAERHLQQRPDVDALVRAHVVERPAQRTGRRQRLHLDDGV